MAQLKAKCEAKGGQESGTKGVLIARLGTPSGASTTGRADARRRRSGRRNTDASAASRRRGGPRARRGCIGVSAGRTRSGTGGTDVATHGHNCICGKTSHGWEELHRPQAQLYLRERRPGHGMDQMRRRHQGSRRTDGSGASPGRTGAYAATTSAARVGPRATPGRMKGVCQLPAQRRGPEKRQLRGALPPRLG